MQFKQWFKKHWVSLLPILLLNIIAMRQINLVNTDYLTRWKGGGFGMFADISYRSIHIHLIHRGTFECADHPRIIRSALRKIMKYPNYLSMEKLVQSLIQYRWIYKKKTLGGKIQDAVYMIPKSYKLKPTDKLAPVDLLELQVYDIKFDPITGKTSPVLLRVLSQVKK